MCENDFDEEEVGQGVANGLIDKVYAGAEDFEGFFLTRIAGFVGGNGVESVVGEDDGAVAVGLEVDADVELFGGVVEIFDTGGSAVDLELQVFFYVFGGCAIGVCSLDNPDLELVCEVGLADEVSKE